MYEITILIKNPGTTSRLMALIVRSEAYDDVEGVRVARLGGHLDVESTAAIHAEGRGGPGRRGRLDP